MTATTTDLTRARRDVSRKRPANAVTSNNGPKVIDGTARPTRSAGWQAFVGITGLVFGLMFLGLLMSLTGYYSS